MVAAVGVMSWLFMHHAELAPIPALMAWVSAIGCVLLAALLSDLRQGWQRCFDSVDWAMAGMFFLLAFAARCVGHMSFSVDEQEVFREIMGRYPDPAGVPWELSGTRFPFLIHDAILAAATMLRPAIDPLDTAKLIVMSAASLSVAAWYLTVRVFGSRVLASSAAILLLFLGLHWVNSRFLYLYPFDMASLSVGILCLVLAFERRLLFPAVMAGATLAFALTYRRIGLMMVPLFAYICLDYLAVLGQTERRRVIGFTLAVIISAAFAYAPMTLDEYSFENFGRISEAIGAQEQRLAAFGLTRHKAAAVILGDAVQQLFVQGYDIQRHLLRPKGALLDPVFSLLLAIGVVVSLLSAHRQRSSRFQLIGLFLCVLPMVLSFPLDSTEPRGLARRMSCASFFLAWIAAGGGVALAGRVLRGRAAATMVVGLCLASLSINFYYLKSHYISPAPETWHYDYGGSRAALLRFVRSAASRGVKVIVLNHPFLGAQQAHYDLPWIFEANNSAEIRSQLGVPFDGIRMVVLPTSYITGSPKAVYQQLEDLIPAVSWSDGPPDMQGIPLYSYATLTNKGAN